MHHALARPDSQFLCCTCVYFLCDILRPEVQSHSDDSPVHAPGLRSACALAQAHPTGPYNVMHSSSINDRDLPQSFQVPGSRFNRQHATHTTHTGFNF